MSIKTPHLTVLSIDGLSYDLLQKLMADGDMPTMSHFCETHGIPRKMRSTFPPVSCVAWTSYATGLNPGKHGIFGFVDRKPGTYDTVFPNGDFVRGQTIWEILSDDGKKVFGMNVPCTFPPRKVNGIMIGGFLASSLDRLSYPPAIGKYLEKQGYRIDINPFIGHSSKEELISELELVLEKRIEALLYFLEYEHWDFFHAHTGTLEVIEKNAQKLANTEVASLTLESSSLIAYDRANKNPKLGRFVLIRNGNTVGGGIIE